MNDNKEIMAANIKHYMEIQNVNATEICNALNIKQNTFSDWVNAKTYPRIDKIEKMANYFGISKANLVEPYKDKDEHVSQIEIELANLYRQNLHLEAYRELISRNIIRQLLDTAKDRSDDDIQIAINILNALKKGDHQHE